VSFFEGVRRRSKKKKKKKKTKKKAAAGGARRIAHRFVASASPFDLVASPRAIHLFAAINARRRADLIARGVETDRAPPTAAEPR